MKQDLIKIHIVGKVNENIAEMQLWLKDASGQGRWVNLPDAGKPPWNARVIQVFYQDARLGWVALIEYLDVSTP